MKSAMLILGSLALIVVGSFFIQTQDDEPKVYVTPAPDYLTEDVWTCLQKLGVLDRNNFTSTEPPDYAEDTLIWVYKVYNVARDETRAVTIEYGYDGTGSSVVVNCWPPNEWMNWPGVPSVTPYVLPEEVENGGTPVS